MIIHTKRSLPYHTYRISYHKLLSQIIRVSPGVCRHQISLQHIIHHPSPQVVSHYLTTIKLLLKKVNFFIDDHNTQKMMTSNETRLTVAIVYLIVSEVLSFTIP